jgi:hypothetical protein
MPSPPGARKRRKAVVEQMLGYQFIRFAEQSTEVERDVRESLDELLNLVPSSHPRLDDPPNLDPELVAQFLSRWGMAGRRLLIHPEKFELAYPPRVGAGQPRIVGAGHSQMAREIQFDLSLREFTNEDEFKLSASFGMPNARQILELEGKEWLIQHLLQISMGHETPFNWIEYELIDLALAARVVKSFGLVDGLNKSGLELTKQKRKQIESECGVEAKEAVVRFALIMNHYLSPLTDPIVSTRLSENYWEKDLEYSAAFSSWLLDLLLKGGVWRICQECGGTFVPGRVKIENKFCSIRCGDTKRKREHARRTRLAQKLSIQLDSKSPIETEKGKVASEKTSNKTN